MLTEILKTFVFEKYIYIYIYIYIPHQYMFSDFHPYHSGTIPNGKNVKWNSRVLRSNDIQRLIETISAWILFIRQIKVVL